jgi:hypothetical protein
MLGRAAAAVAAAAAAATAAAARPTPTFPVPAAVINLDSRPDRWAAIQAQWANVTTVALERWPATRHFAVPGRPHPAHGCAASHVAAATALRARLDTSIPAVLVLEDDAVPVPSFDDRFRAVWEWVLAHPTGWELISLGPSRVTPADDDRDPPQPRLQRVIGTDELLRAELWSSAAGILYNQRAAAALDRVAAGLGSAPLSSPDSAIDFLLAHDPDVVTLVAAPVLMWQAPGYSDLMHGMTDYTALYGMAESILGTTRRVLAREPGVRAVRVMNATTIVRDDGWPDDVGVEADDGGGGERGTAGDGQPGKVRGGSSAAIQATAEAVVAPIGEGKHGG